MASIFPRGWLREFVLSGVVFSVLWLVFLVLGVLEFLDDSIGVTSIICGLFLFTHWIGSIFGWFPAGNENAMARLGLAAFCRTFAPLLALLLIDHYLMSVLTQTNLGLIIASYLSSLALTIIAAFRTLGDRALGDRTLGD